MSHSMSLAIRANNSGVFRSDLSPPPPPPPFSSAVTPPGRRDRQTRPIAVTHSGTSNITACEKANAPAPATPPSQGAVRTFAWRDDETAGLMESSAVPLDASLVVWVITAIERMQMSCDGGCLPGWRGSSRTSATAPPLTRPRCESSSCRWTSCHHRSSH